MSVGAVGMWGSVGPVGACGSVGPVGVCGLVRSIVFCMPVALICTAALAAEVGSEVCGEDTEESQLLCRPK
jgi:hypothetical protein